MRKTLNTLGLVFAGLIATALIVGGFTAYYNTRTAHDCKIVDKDRVWISNHDGSGGQSQMRVYTENCGSFQVNDNIFKTDFHSADRYAKIKVGKTYDIDYYGFRLGFFNQFPKIESIR